MKCIHCEKEIGSSAFCPYCGEPQAVKVYCPNCGKEMTSNDKFCTNCGSESFEEQMRKLKEEKTEEERKKKIAKEIERKKEEEIERQKRQEREKAEEERQKLLEKEQIALKAEERRKNEEEKKRKEQYEKKEKEFTKKMILTGVALFASGILLAIIGGAMWFVAIPTIIAGLLYIFILRTTDQHDFKTTLIIILIYLGVLLVVSLFHAWWLSILVMILGYGIVYFLIDEVFLISL